MLPPALHVPTVHSAVWLCGCVGVFSPRVVLLGQGAHVRSELEALVALLPSMLHSIHVAAVAPPVAAAASYYAAFTRFVREQCGGPTASSPPLSPLPTLAALCAGPAPSTAPSAVPSSSIAACVPCGCSWCACP